MRRQVAVFSDQVEEGSWPAALIRLYGLMWTAPERLLESALSGVSGRLRDAWVRDVGAGAESRESRSRVASGGVERADGDAVRVTALTETSRLVCRTKSIAEGDRRADLPTVIRSPVSLPPSSVGSGW